MNKIANRRKLVSISRPSVPGTMERSFAPVTRQAGPSRDAPARRLFIDCHAIDFTKQPTGIPRVVKKYIEVGYAWAARRGIEVIPVVASADGLSLVRPVPGKGAPQELMSRANANEFARQSGHIQTSRMVWNYVKDVIHHGLNLAAALLPIPPVKAAGTWIDELIENLTASGERYIERYGPGAITYRARPGDVLLAPAYWHDVDPAIYHSLRLQGLEIVILVHDLLPIVFEHFYPAPWRYLFKDNVRAAFGYASAFFCVSNCTRAALREFAYRNKLAEVPMMTAYNGFEPLVSDAAAADIAQAPQKPMMGNGKLFEVAKLQPLLMVGSVEPKKGHIPVVKCLEALWQAGYQRPLLIIGRPGWMEEDVVTTIRESFFFNKKMFWFSDADDYDLALAYIFCHALVFSSLAEGFGIPMIEAAYYGKPTIALDTPIVREILGANALLFSSAADFVQHVTGLDDAQAYAAACRAAESVGWPLWEEYTPQVFDRLIDFVTGQASLPDRVPPKAELSIPLREVVG